MLQEVFATVVTRAVLSLGPLIMALLTMTPYASACLGEAAMPSGPRGYQQRLCPEVNGLR